jgi:cell shape-determining protein MreC
MLTNHLLTMRPKHSAVVALRSAVDSLKQEIEARKQLDAINERLQERQRAEIADQNKLIVLLQKKTGRSFSVLFGLIKIRF